MLKIASRPLALCVHCLPIHKVLSDDCCADDWGRDTLGLGRQTAIVRPQDTTLEEESPLDKSFARVCYSNQGTLSKED